MGSSSKRDEDLPPGPRGVIISDHSHVPDEAVGTLPVNLLEYLEHEDIPTPDYHPPVPALAPTNNNDSSSQTHLAPQPPVTPRSSTDHLHVHSFQCPQGWEPASLKPIFRDHELKSRLESAGIMNFIKFNFPRQPINFLDDEWRKINWSQDDNTIVIDTGAAGTEPTVIDTAYLQRLWPGLPARNTHKCYVVPDGKNRNFMKEAVGRYFAIEATCDVDGFFPVIYLQPCFHKPLRTFLIRLAYLFGWRGYPDSFPVHMYPMAIMTFASGYQFAWAELLLTELTYDIRYRRRCPRLGKIWVTIYHSVANRSLPTGVEDTWMPFGPEIRRLHESYLERCVRMGEPFLWDQPYLPTEISRWTPSAVREVVIQGAKE
ncbi:hypothetical protein R1flu_005968 [Riccia fluitans]|uniref:Uncharacterized protein n=1 Tax=Riccia fluitans TaxID=41844 RepID=A0ABD1YUP7_9MARC